jgi:hypothetical protein
LPEALLRFENFGRPCGAFHFSIAVPAVKTAGYFQMFLWDKGWRRLSAVVFSS